MAEEEKELPQTEEKAKTPWQIQKESLYDKIPLTVKQLDIIIWAAWAGLGLLAVKVVLDALGITG